MRDFFLKILLGGYNLYFIYVLIRHFLNKGDFGTLVAIVVIWFLGFWVMSRIFRKRDGTKKSRRTLRAEAVRGKALEEERVDRAQEAERLRAREKTEDKKPPPPPPFKGSIMSEAHALELFELSKPYTPEELKRRRMDLLKKVHPDQGGSNMMARLVNEAYEILKEKI